MMIKDGWYRCNECGRKVFIADPKAIVKGVYIRCRNGNRDVRKVKTVIIEPKLAGDMDALQLFLEMAHVSMNKGICQSYNICKYCREPEKMTRSSPTPCADAFLLMYEQKGKKEVFAPYKAERKDKPVPAEGTRRKYRKRGASN